jgi:hypothetical protein
MEMQRNFQNLIGPNLGGTCNVGVSPPAKGISMRLTVEFEGNSRQGVYVDRGRLWESQLNNRKHHNPLL